MEKIQIGITSKNTSDSLNWTYNKDQPLASSMEFFLIEKTIKEHSYNLKELIDGTYLLNFENPNEILNDFSGEIESILSKRKLRDFGSQFATVHYESADITVNLHDENDQRLITLVTFYNILKNAIIDHTDIELEIRTWSQELDI